MKLWRIRNKKTGKFYNHSLPSSSRMSRTGYFYTKKPTQSQVDYLTNQYAKAVWEVVEYDLLECKEC